jgi:hypothetical protein
MITAPQKYGLILLNVIFPLFDIEVVYTKLVLVIGSDDQ